MQSGQKQVVLGKGEKERRERRKETGKRKKKQKEGKKEKNRKEKKGEQTNQNTKNKGEYPLILYTVNPLTSPGTLQCCLVNNLFLPYQSSWSSWGGACCADFHV